MGNMNAKGRQKKPSFFGMRRDIYKSDAFQTLRSPAKVIYWELRQRFRKNPNTGSSNNGEISLSVREAKKVANAAQNTVQAALQQLQRHGLIRINNKGYFTNMHATTFILTDEPFDGKPPTNEWRTFKKSTVSKCDT